MARKFGPSGGMKRAKRSGRRRSAFRDEFYRDRQPDNADRAPIGRAKASPKRRRRRTMPVWLPVFGLFLLFCVLAVAGSSAMIWLRKIGPLFGVEWAGDG